MIWVSLVINIVLLAILLKIGLYLRHRREVYQSALNKHQTMEECITALGEATEQRDNAKLKLKEIYDLHLIQVKALKEALDQREHKLLSLEASVLEKKERIASVTKLLLEKEREINDLKDESRGYLTELTLVKAKALTPEHIEPQYSHTNDVIRRTPLMSGGYLEFHRHRGPPVFVDTDYSRRATFTCGGTVYLLNEHHLDWLVNLSLPPAPTHVGFWATEPLEPYIQLCLGQYELELPYLPKELIRGVFAAFSLRQSVYMPDMEERFNYMLCVAADCYGSDMRSNEFIKDELLYNVALSFLNGAKSWAIDTKNKTFTNIHY